jgi:Peroxisomal biogenesis factor 11 (PEX11)
MHRLLTTTAGLDTFLSTFNYALYILAYFEARPSLRRAFLRPFFQLASPESRASKTSVLHPGSPPTIPQIAPLQSLASLISDTRTTLRLTALLALYSWLRGLLGGNERQDRVLKAISLTQCICYIIYQFTENVAFLAERGIISKKWLEKRGGSARWWMWSNRAWLAGVSCDFLRLIREALIEREKRKKQRQGKEGRTEADDLGEQPIDRRWWSEVFVTSCWFPLCLHYSLQEGLKGVNDGVVGLLGFMAGAQSFTAQWANIRTK